MARTDIHRPSEIKPEDYEFVCVQYLWTTGDDAIGEASYNKEQQEIFWHHREKTGGKFAAIEHGGTCYCCGATARFVARYYHPQTNSYIDLGQRCAIKLDEGEDDAFRTLRRAVANTRAAIAGKRKAKLILSDLGLNQAWEIYEAGKYYDTREESTVLDIVRKVVQYGQISENQAELVKNLLNYINNKEAVEAERKAKRDAENANAAPCPAGKVKITGTILSVKVKEHNYGTDLKILVRDVTGFKVYGNLPKVLNDLIEWRRDNFSDENIPRLKQKEVTIEFEASVTPSTDDPKFGFFKRPTKTKILDSSVEATEAPGE